MRKAYLIIVLLSSILLLSFSARTHVQPLQPVNAVIGDISYENKFGRTPDQSEDEDLRISTHLEFVEDLLRKRDASRLTHDEKVKRNHILDLLHEYRMAGRFPRNYDFADERKPCFIDKDGRICAVGYLIEHTSGRNTAEQINRNHKYEKISEMNDRTVSAWIESSGLTMEECAMIQPTYGPPPVYTKNYISPGYGIGSSVWTGANIAFSAIDAVQLTKGTDKKLFSVLGMASGAGQILFGIGNMPEEISGMYVTTNESQKVLSMVNIGMGTSTLILSTWNLLANRKQKSKTTSWNIIGVPANDDVSVVFSFAKRF